MGKRKSIIVGVSVSSPCGDCTERRVGCHSGCEAYARFRAELYKLKQDKYAADLEFSVERLRERDRSDWMLFRAMCRLGKRG